MRQQRPKNFQRKAADPPMRLQAQESTKLSSHKQSPSDPRQGGWHE